MTAPAIEGGELVKRLRDYDDGRSVDQIDLQADIALRLMDEAAAFIEQSSTLLADAKRERDAALAESVGMVYALQNIRDIPDQQAYVGIVRRCAQGAIDALSSPSPHLEWSG